MRKQDITLAIESLKQKQQIFHSEADFQFSLAWELQRILPSAKIRLEYCPPFAREMHIDIYVIDEDGSYPIELKYKSKTVETIVDNEYYKLKNHGAQDLGRYDFLYDIWRIERMKKLDKDFKTGFAIMLSNEASYWKTPTSTNTVDAAFRIHHGRVVHGVCAWGENVSSGTSKNREEPIVFDGTYTLAWKPYSNLENTSNGEFKICVIEVSNS